MKAQTEPSPAIQASVPEEQRTNPLADKAGRHVQLIDPRDAF
jgi:hypothetical protein